MVDMTPVKNVAAYRFTFSASEKGCHVVLDVSQPIERFEGGEIKVRAGKTLEGFGTDDTGIHFSFQFSEPNRKRGGGGGGVADGSACRPGR